MNKYSTCCSFVAQLNRNKTEKKNVNSESIIFQNLSPTPTASAHLFGQDFPPPKKVQPTFFQVVTYKKKRDSIHPEPSLKQTLQQDISNFHGFLEHKTSIIYSYVSLWGLHGYTWPNKWCDIYIAPGGKPMSIPRHSLIWAAWMQLASVTKRMACAFRVTGTGASMATDLNPLRFSVSAWAW